MTILKTIVALVVLAAFVVVTPNAIMLLSQGPKIVSEEEAVAQVLVLDEDLLAGNDPAPTPDAPYDCIIVLGAAVLPSGEPSTILADRIDTAARLYFAGVAPKIVMSGDDKSDTSYDEVTNMKRYAVEELGVPSEDVFCDHAGLNTYDTMYRAYHVFGAHRAVVVTQTYHLYRALFDAASFHIDCIGVPSDAHAYTKQAWFSFREAGARVSDMIKVLRRDNATLLSEPVSLNQSGDVTSWNKHDLG